MPRSTPGSAGCCREPFTFKRVEGLRPAIQKVTDECIDAILAGPQPADLVDRLALPVPTAVISEMLGVPYEDHEFFQEHANAGLARYATARTPQKGAMSLHKYLIDLVEKKMENPAEDAVSDLAERVTAGEISVKEAAQLGTGLLIAGHETTANMIGIGVLALLQNPEQAELLRNTDDPEVDRQRRRGADALSSIIQNGQRRVATEDIEIGDVTIRAGEGIIIDLAPANWDAEAFPNPEQLDLARENAGQEVGFGFGRHQCVGQQLARAELQIVFHTLVRRIPTMKLAIRSTRCRSRTIGWPTACTACPSPGNPLSRRNKSFGGIWGGCGQRTSRTTLPMALRSVTWRNASAACCSGNRAPMYGRTRPSSNICCNSAVSRTASCG